MKRAWHKYRYGDGVWSEWVLMIDDTAVLTVETIERLKDRIMELPPNAYVFQMPAVYGPTRWRLERDRAMREPVDAFLDSIIEEGGDAS